MADEEIAKVPTVYHNAVVRDLKRIIVALSVLAAIEGAAMVALVVF